MKKTILNNNQNIRKSVIGTALIFTFITLFTVLSLFSPAVGMAQQSSEVTAEKSSANMGEILPIKVYANADDSDKCFVVTLGGNGAGLSNEYIFDKNNTAKITDNSGKVITLNRNIGGDGAVNYWFELSKGESSEFSLNCTSGIYVATDSDINEYEPKITVDENGKEFTLSEEEIIEHIKSEKQAENSETEKIEMTVFFGYGDSFKTAMDNSAHNDTLSIEWNAQKSKKLSKMSTFAVLEKYIDGGQITDTVFWKRTQNLSGEITLTIYGTGDIPSYNSNNTEPFNKNSVTNIIVEDGITKIGKFSFCNLKAKNLSIGKDVTYIGYSAFQANNFTKVVIPGNVKTIDSCAFRYMDITSITLSEGLETINSQAFDSAKITALHLPSTITSVTALEGCKNIKEITLGDNNDNGTFFVEDNVLFQRLSNGGVVLIQYSPKKSNKEYIIPQYVTQISAYSFNYTTNLKKLTISAGVKKVGNSILAGSAVEEVFVEEGANCTNSHAFSFCTNLRKLTLHKDSVKGVYFYFTIGNQLEYVYIPAGVNNLVDNALGGCTPNLKTVYYDAIGCSAIQKWSRVNKYELIIGENVNKLYSYTGWGGNANGFQMVLASAKDVKFAGPNQITIQDEVFDKMPVPLNALSGSIIWVDEQGVVYKYDKTNKTASVAYVPYGVTSVTIPETITPETNVTCTVNSIDTYAFKLAEDLTSVNFDNPQIIETISAYGFANCSKLESVNGETSEESAAASFTNAKIGSRAFVNTSLTSASGKVSYEQAMNGKKMIDFNDFTLSVEGGEWIQNEKLGEVGGYKYLTSQVSNIRIKMKNTTEGSNVYRLYFEFSEPDGIFSIAPGEELTFGEEINMRCYATDAPNICYIDFTSVAGATSEALLTASYKSPVSVGGEMKIWGFVMNKETAESTVGQIVECDETSAYSDSIQCYWTTQADTFIADKSMSGKVKVNLIGDGNGNIVPENDISWLISFKRESSETLSVGKDFVKSVDFYDYINLPEHIMWNPDVIEAVKNNNTRCINNTIYAGDIKIASIGSGYSFTAEWDNDKGTIVFHWTRYNSSSTSEIGLSNINLTIGKQALCTDSALKGFPSNTDFVLDNRIYSVVHYSHSADKTTTEKQANHYLTLKPATLEFSKTAPNTSSTKVYFGDDFTYKITLKNSGSAAYIAAENGSYRVNEPLNENLYIKPENIEKMLKDKFGKNLVIKITGAKFTSSKDEVTASDGTTAYKTSANSDIPYTEGDLTVSWDGDTIKVVLSDGTEYPATDSLTTVFDKLGLYVSKSTKYTLDWILNGSDEKFTLYGGEVNKYDVYATLKDTFMLLTNDYPGNYQKSDTNKSKYFDIYNTAYLYNNNNKSIKSTNRTTNRIYIEAYIVKTAFKHNSEQLSENFNIAVNDVIDYYVTFNHYGNGKYNNLPMVDDISGTQVLLVSVADNKQLESLNLPTYTVEENGENIEYYKLNKAGTYKNVVVGINEYGEKMMADIIKVSEANDGLNTQIKWYYSHLDGGRYLLEVGYHTLVDFDLLKSTDYSISNTAWMNDRTKDRIYAPTFGGGSLLNFDKEIVYKNDDGTYTADDDDFSAIGIGESVIYRLTLSNPNEFNININGNDILDRLPINANLFNWEKDKNVSLLWQETEGTTVFGADNWTIEKDPDEEDSTGSYCIKWSPDTSITIQPNKRFCMYVTLTFPNDSKVWENYCEYVGGNEICNRFFVYGYPEEVNHSLKGTSEAALQKGVYSTLRYSGNSFYETPSRVYYNNRDYANRAIMYYVTLYNGGSNRLYLTDMVDRLPEGFTFLTLKNSASTNGNMTNTVQTLSNNPNYLVNMTISGKNVNFRSVNVTCENLPDNMITFKFSRADSASNAVRYDEREQKLYLEKGEAIVFSYICDIGLTNDSLARATNVIGMNYYDYLETGVSAVGEELSVKGTLTENHTDQNDGTRIAETAENVSSRYGFDGSGNWLISDVTVVRGGIIPGITNYTDSYTDMNGNVYPYKNNASPYSTINWRTRMHNSGFRSITDYTLEDTLPERYSLTGSISLNIYEYAQNGPVSSFKDIIKVVSERKKGDESITVKSNLGNEYTIPFNGERVEIPVSISSTQTTKVYFSIKRNENGQEVFTIDFEERFFSIPEVGGYADLTYSSINVSQEIKNTVYTNSSVFIPNSQKFSSTTQGSIVYEDSRIIGTTNNSSVNISYGLSTSSVKSVTEIGYETNTTDSKQSTNYITLHAKENEFRYNLSVKNETDFSMEKLVLIDALPNLNDTSPFDPTALRGSEFAVLLSENPEFSVSIAYPDGETKVLEQSKYSIDFKTDNTLNDDDWKGTTAWSDSADNARAIRLIINDVSLIPDDAVVMLGFNAKAETGVTAGMKAWNSFGYHYVLNNDGKTELEAMPAVVGVQIVETPTIQKNIVDIEGEDYRVKQDTTFSFLVYEGEKFEGDFPTADELIQALEKSNIPYNKIDLLIKEGESSSEQKMLLDYDKLEWIDDKKYTVVELSNSDLYKLDSWNYVSQDSITFTYYYNKAETLICKNVFKEWSISLSKIDGDTAIKLANAQFAIYSPKADDLISEENYNNLEYKPDKTITYKDKVWYLKDVRLTDANGKIDFDKLLCNEYCIKEIVSPSGYILTAEPKIISNNSLVQKLEVFNYKAPVLPNTGNKGIFDFIAFGVGMLIAVAAFWIYRKVKINNF